MSAEPVPVTVTIMDKEYRIACPPEERQSLLASAEFLNDRLRDIRDGGRVIGADRVAVMAALNLAHELLLEKARREALSHAVGERLQALNARVEQGLEPDRPSESPPALRSAGGS